MVAPSQLFIDTSYVLGLFNVADQYHRLCVEAVKYNQEAKRLYTTDAVLMEVGNAFSSVERRPKGSMVIRDLLNDPQIEIIHLNPQYFEKALKLFEKRDDKTWGMVDCFSFVVMKEFKLKAALTTDHHFEQAGFKILPF